MKPILTISLIISIIGILILLILSNSQEPEKINIKNIGIQNINQKIQTQGTIVSIKTYNNFEILNLRQNYYDNYSIAILINKKTNLTKNQTIEVIGKIIEYKDSLEIQAEKIKIIKK